MDERDERAIGDGLQRGRTEAWHRLYDAYAPHVWRWVARRVPGDPGDVVQEVFMAAARSAPAFDPARGTLSAWLFGIARRQAALAMRRRARADEVAADVRRSAARPAPGAGPHDVDASDRADAVRTALRALPEEYEALLTSKYLDDMSVSAIAVQTGRTETAVRSKLARARRALREQLGGPIARPKEERP